MEYRHLGKAGIKVSELSLGAWVTYGGQVGEQIAQDCMIAAYEAGVNFFDNAEVYADGKAETVMGNVLKSVGWKRESIVVSTKIFWGGDGVNDTGLNYKHLFEGVNNRFQAWLVILDGLGDLIKSKAQGVPDRLEEIFNVSADAFQYGKQTFAFTG